MLTSPPSPSCTVVVCRTWNGSRVEFVNTPLFSAVRRVEFTHRSCLIHGGCVTRCVPVPDTGDDVSSHAVASVVKRPLQNTVHVASHATQRHLNVHVVQDATHSEANQSTQCRRTTRDASSVTHQASRFAFKRSRLRFPAFYCRFVGGIFPRCTA